MLDLAIQGSAVPCELFQWWTHYHCAPKQTLERFLKPFRFLKVGTKMAISVHLSRPKLIFRLLSKNWLIWRSTVICQLESNILTQVHQKIYMLFGVLGSNLNFDRCYETGIVGGRQAGGM